MRSRTNSPPRWYVVLRRVIIATGILSFLPVLLQLLGILPEIGLGILLPLGITWIMLIVGATLEITLRIQRFRQLSRGQDHGTAM